MRLSRKKLVDYLVYLALRVVVMFLHMFSREAAYGLMAQIGDWMYRLDRRHRDRAAEHVRASFPEWPERKVQQVVRGSFRNLGYLAIETMLTTRLIMNYSWRNHLELVNVSDTLRRLLGAERGVIFVAGHFGGWEVVGYTLATLGFDGYAVARWLDNPHLNEYVLGVRERTGMRILDKRGATARMDEILSRGDYVSFIADQDAGRGGVFVDFFGRKASTYKAPALMAMQYNLPVMVGYGKRLGEQYRFEVGIERIIRPAEWADKDDPLAWITQEYTAALEASIRRAPEQYLWIYRRWKTRPRGERADAKAS